MNANERLLARIESTIPSIPSGSTDRQVLSYIATQLTPGRLKWREEHDVGGESHLHEVAKQRLRPYEVKEDPQHD